MAVEILDAVDDLAEWLSIWESTGREPFAHPAYVELFEGDGARAHCAVIRSGDGRALVPFLLRPIRHGGWAPSGGYLDAISPYGYGGPYATPGFDYRDVWFGLKARLSELGVVSFFGRLALGQVPREVPEGTEIVTDADNVVVNLSRTAAEQWVVYEHKVRKNVNRALRSGLTSEVRESFADIAEFTNLYLSTMDRRNAAARYYFDEGFFKRISSELPRNRLVAEVRDSCGALVSGELVLTSDKYLYSFLGGTAEDAFALRPNDLLKHAVIDYGRTNGFEGYVLGGGLERDDGIYRYKRSFEPSGSMPFMKLEMVCNARVYRELVASRRKADPVMEGAGGLPPTFFPAYRAPSSSP